MTADQGNDVIIIKANNWTIIKRFFDVLILFVSFFNDFLLLKIRFRLRPGTVSQSDYKRIYASQASRFRTKAGQMGGLLIKLGQFISVHVDVIPEEYTSELSKLQDEVESVAFADIRRIVTEELGDREITLAEKPLASASLGQVHRAELPDGKIAAVKVLKPDIDRLVGTDLAAMRWVAWFAGRFTSWGRNYDIKAIYKEFEATTKRELDLVQEGENAVYLAGNLKEFEHVLIPKIYWDYTSRRVLTMEFMEGSKITERKQLKEWGVDRKALSELLFEVFWHQVMQLGFFHADPHPGNILVNAKGELILLDFGLVSEIGSRQKQQFFELMAAFIAGDSVKFSVYLDKLGFVRQEVERELLEQSMEVLMTAVVEMGRQEEISEELQEFLYAQPFQLPANILFLGKTFSTLMGVVYGLNNDFDFMKRVSKMVTAGDSGQYRLGKLIPSLQGIVMQARKFLQIPDQMDSLRKELRVTNEKLDQNSQAVTALINSLVLVILTASSAIITAVLYAAEKPQANSTWLATIVLGGVLLLTLLGKKPKKFNKRRVTTPKGNEAPTPPPGFKKPKFHP